MVLCYRGKIGWGVVVFFFDSRIHKSHGEQAKATLLLLLGGSVDEGDEGGVIEVGGEEGLEDGGDVDSLVGLVVLQKAADGASSGAEGGVEHVDVGLGSLASLLTGSTEANLHAAGLEVRAVRARNELAVVTHTREVALNVVLLGSGGVQLSRNDVDDLVREAQRLVELLGNAQKGLVHLPRLLGRGDDELLNLLELMHTEDTPGITTMSASLLTEASRVTGITDGKNLRVQPLSKMHGSNRLLRSSNQVLLSFLIDRGNLLKKRDAKAEMG